MARRPLPHFELPTAASNGAYALLRPLARWVFRFWHRVEVEGLEHLRVEGGSRPARLFFSGHQNGMADPVFACVSLPAQMHYFTRADVFTQPVARWFILRMNMLPIYRPKDRIPDLPERNQRTFAAAHQRLDRGAWCGIFPEAGHQPERRTRRFKHGSSRFVLGALSRPAVKERGLQVLPMTFDFVRYDGYRSTARLRVGAPIELDDLGAEPQDSGPHRVLVSDRMKVALSALSVELLEGPLYDAHLAICRCIEGAGGTRPEPAFLADVADRLQAEESEVIEGFTALLDAGMPHPRQHDAFEGLGRLIAKRPTQLAHHAWRWPFWLLFRVTTGWWPRLVEKRMANHIRSVGFRTTFGIPATLLGVGATWLLLGLAISMWFRGFAFGLMLLVALRLCQSMAMPLEDALADRKSERAASPFLDHKWVKQWCSPD